MANVSYARIGGLLVAGLLLLVGCSAPQARPLSTLEAKWTEIPRTCGFPDAMLESFFGEAYHVPAEPKDSLYRPNPQSYRDLKMVNPDGGIELVCEAWPSQFDSTEYDYSPDSPQVNASTISLWYSPLGERTLTSPPQWGHFVPGPARAVAGGVLESGRDGPFVEGTWICGESQVGIQITSLPDPEDDADRDRKVDFMQELIEEMAPFYECSETSSPQPSPDGKPRVG